MSAKFGSASLASLRIFMPKNKQEKLELQKSKFRIKNTIYISFLASTEDIPAPRETSSPRVL
jgi:hypothetical protein